MTYAKLFTFINTAVLFSLTAIAAPQKFEAQLAGYAILQAQTFIATPKEAGEHFNLSGKFTQPGKRLDTPYSQSAKSGQFRQTNLKLPFENQAVQGHSGIKVMPDGTVWLLTDNGFGTKKNSADSALFINQYRINWEKGNLERLRTVFLQDPHKIVPFPIQNENTATRYLTGADFDPESIQIHNDHFWIGEEFGPYLLEADQTGNIVAIYDTLLDSHPLRSPDNPALTLPSSPDKPLPDFQVKRSKGFEGMAKYGSTLYPMLEGALWDNEKQQYENVKGKHYLRILEFDLDRKAYTGKSWQYPLESNLHAIGDFNMINAQYGLVIERDNLEGTTAYPCLSDDKTHCFDQSAKFKRIYKIRLADNGIAEKVAYIDLMDIADPNKIARNPLVNGRFVFPFFTIENVDIVDENHIIVGNDNNLPFSASREPNTVDDNELILLNVGEFLK
ncbi:glycerophosphodiester phosphodiesterase [[Actinobacillus] muris]|uniref:Glycerophosphodiester phosphodiesterase n=1 Tax=Muribacter muris TaxID=67855 RepID=A0A0J5P8G2_9PAST|nr:esterase-like activity of phytase family protein [Muribacter muris]KMK52035.1 glycerophosphodiester phosphodiesterase [[Actinobacillus] muris] [Muribacter muris]